MTAMASIAERNSENDARRCDFAKIELDRGREARGVAQDIKQINRLTGFTGLHDMALRIDEPAEKVRVRDGWIAPFDRDRPPRRFSRRPPSG